ncbi:HU family DNA-binding protein [Candidatus Hepatincolaceae symbiont of Richtersius coronifer]
MNKTELIVEVSKHSGLSKTDSEKFLNAFMQSIEMALANDDDVRLVGFGTFSTTKRKAGEGRNPRSGEVIQIAASTLPKFKAGKSLKDSLNNTDSAKKTSANTSSSNNFKNTSSGTSAGNSNSTSKSNNKGSSSSKSGK